jgi:putative CocE/NonD family hydrolase
VRRRCTCKATARWRFRKPTAGAPLTYTYDPQNPVPTVGGRELSLPAGPRDQRKIESRPDVLVFTSAPLPQPLEIVGRVKAVLYVASDAPDTDFIVRLCDVYPDGRSYNIAEGALRTRYRESRSRERFMRAGQGLSGGGRPVDDGNRVQRGASAARAYHFQQRARLRPEPKHRRAVPRQRTHVPCPQHRLLRRATRQLCLAARRRALDQSRG